MDSAKIKIENIVKDYISLFPKEYNNFKEGVKMKINLQINKFGDLTKTSDFIIRPLFEIPEVVDDLIQNRLDDNELKWFRNEGGKWFAKKFVAFRLVEKI